MTGGQAIAEVLKREGVEFVFCFPSNPLIDAAAARGIRPIVAREERVLLNMADAYVRATNARRVAAVMVQGGPGIEHAFGGVAQAYADSVPILVLPGGAARSRVSMPTTFDAVKNYQGITKWADRFPSAAAVPSMMRRAFTYMRAGHPGPVLLETPGDVVGEQFDDAAFEYTPPKRLRSMADPDAVRDVVRLLLAAEKPMIHAGQGVLWAEASPELLEFAELVQAPVMTTLAGKSSFREDHALSLGAGGASLAPGVHYYLPKADFVISIGASLARTLGSAAIPGGKKMVQCVTDDRDVNVEYPLEGALIGDAKLVLQQLIEEVKRQAGANGRRDKQELAKEVSDAKQRTLQELMPKLRADGTPINPYRIVWDLMHTVDRTKTVITHDSGYPRDHTAPIWESLVPRGYIGWGNSTPLGSSLGIALGAKIADPDKLVINVMGDAAFGQCGMDVETGVRNKLPILTVLINNSEMGVYEKMQPIAQEKFNIKHLTGDYTAVATALGAYAERVEDPHEIVPAIKRAEARTKDGQPALLEFITQPDPTVLRL